jgi:hypothetical protein
MSLAVIDRVRQHTRGTGQHRMVDENTRLEHRLDKSSAANGELRRRLAEATEARDAANAKVSYLGEIEAQLAATTQRADSLEVEVTALRSQLANMRKVSDLGAHSAVTATQPIPVLPLHLSPLAGNTSPSHVPGL